MHVVLALLLLQGTVAISGEWVGPLEWHDSRGRSIVPTLVTLTYANGTITGEWVSLNFPHGSGPISGTLDDAGRVRVTVTLYGGRAANGELTAAEGCSGTAEFRGELTRSRMFRWTADAIVLDTPDKRRRERHCENMRRPVWILQRRDLTLPGH